MDNGFDIKSTTGQLYIENPKFEISILGFKNWQHNMVSKEIGRIFGKKIFKMNIMESAIESIIQRMRNDKNGQKDAINISRRIRSYLNKRDILYASTYVNEKNKHDTPEYDERSSEECEELICGNDGELLHYTSSRRVNLGGINEIYSKDGELLRYTSSMRFKLDSKNARVYMESHDEGTHMILFHGNQKIDLSFLSQKLSEFPENIDGLLDQIKLSVNDGHAKNLTIFKLEYGLRYSILEHKKSPIFDGSEHSTYEIAKKMYSYIENESLNAKNGKSYTDCDRSILKDLVQDMFALYIKMGIIKETR